MKTDLLNRRLRHGAPNPQKKHLIIGEADLLVFEALDRHGLLPTSYVYEFQKHVRKNYSDFQKRLTELANGERADKRPNPYLTKPADQHDSYNARYQQLVYSLSPRGKQLLLNLGRDCRFPPRNGDWFVHKLMTACASASLELGAKDYRYISRAEILSKRFCKHAGHGVSEDTVRPLAIKLHGFEIGFLEPDDLFGFEWTDADGNKRHRFFALEADRATEKLGTIRGKLRAYAHILDDKLFDQQYGVPNLSVLLLTTANGRAENILDEVRGMGGYLARRFAVAVEPCFGDRWHVPKELLSHLSEKPWIGVDGPRHITQP